MLARIARRVGSNPLRFQNACRSVGALRLPQRKWGPSISARSIASTAPSRDEDPMNGERDVMEYDMVVVGAGPAGLAAAIRAKQVAAKQEKELSVCVLEKGHEVGAHILSGNVFEPRALDDLLPGWREDESCPIKTPVKEDEFKFLLNDSSSVPLPVPPMLHNEGNYIISLGQLCKWMGEKAEEMEVEIIPAYPAANLIVEDGGVKGVVTSDMGVDKEGKPKDSFYLGAEVRAKQTVLAEGCRGNCSEEAMEVFNLREGVDPQTYGLGLKEVWRVKDPENHPFFKPGHVQHTLGWPLPQDTYGGSFLYCMEPDLVLIGFVIGLDYPNPWMSPYQEFQRWKHHPEIAKFLDGGECIQYGARCLNEGGYQSLPKLTMPGAMLAGCSAGFLNVPKIKGSHMAMQTGLYAGESAAAAILDAGEDASKAGREVTEYQGTVDSSWVVDELKAVRNYHPSFKQGLLPGLAYSGLSAFVLKGNEPWTFHNDKPDSQKTKPADECEKIEYPKPDGKLSFDLLSNLQRSGTNHEHDQPSHLRIKPGQEDDPEQLSWAKFKGPESRFCPARVYEYPEEDGKLVINAQNCVHCKCCSIKTPGQYIKWTVPEAGGGGPAYEVM